jgi:predicted MPP superfamily phosphohydrolase
MSDASSAAPRPGSARRRRFKPATMVKIVLVLLVLSAILFAYPVWRLGQWLLLPTWLNLAITLPLFLSQVIARILLRRWHGRVAFVLRGAADYFLGLSPVLLAGVLLGEVVLLFSALPPSVVAQGVLLATAILGLYGLKKAWYPDVVEVSLNSTKLDRTVRFAQISDVHIGSRTTRFLKHIVDRVNQERAEFLCITGDFIDQPGIGADKLRALTEFAGPIYFCTGNHERYEDLEEIVQRLESLGVVVLRNRAVEVDGLQFIGIEDHENAGQVARVLPFIDVNPDAYSILLYHRPQGLEAAARHGIDLKLSGHTHAGQIVPFHLAVNRVFEYTRGLYQLDNTWLYVNEGTGTWGPTLRLGTRSEITLFNLSPTTAEHGKLH